MKQYISLKASTVDYSSKFKMKIASLMQFNLPILNQDLMNDNFHVIAVSIYLSQDHILGKDKLLFTIEKRKAELEYSKYDTYIEYLKNIENPEDYYLDFQKEIEKGLKELKQKHINLNKKVMPFYIFDTPSQNNYLIEKNNIFEKFANTIINFCENIKNNTCLNETNEYKIFYIDNVSQEELEKIAIYCSMRSLNNVVEQNNNKKQFKI
jgi:hypothetical protein